MWRQSLGDWEERRHRRSGPIPTTPQTSLPETMASAEHSGRGFLPKGFHDRVPLSAYPASDGVETRPLRYDAASSQPQSAAHALTEAWVTVTGASIDDVLDVRDFLDAAVGRTVSHYLPPLTHVQANTVYIQFASSMQATQAVRIGSFATRVECGAAAVGIKPTIDAPPPAVAPYYDLDLVISWCTDQVFLAEREKQRRQLLVAATPLPRRSLSTSNGATSRASNERDADTPSLGSSARGAETQGSSGAANDTDGERDAAAHPLLPRHRAGQPPSPSPWTSLSGSASPVHPRNARPSTDDSRSPSSSSPLTQQPQRTSCGDALPVRDPAAYYRTGGAYRYEDSFFSGGLHSASGESRQCSTVLGLFLHPCSSSSGVLYSLCLYTPLRVALLLMWTIGNAMRQLLASSSASARRQAAQHDRAVPPVVLPPLARWRQRRTLRVSDVVPASASPMEYVAYFLYKYIPFTPDPEEVDLVLWSWLALRSPYPQRSLSTLKQSLLVRQRSGNMAVGQLRPSLDGDGHGNTDVQQFARFGRVDVLGAEPHSDADHPLLAGKRRVPPVLLRWRPAWWFARYSSLSLLVVMVLVCCHFLYSWE